MANPTPGTYPVWKPDAAPATRQIGQLKFIVDQVQAGTHHFLYSDSKESGYLDLQILEQDRPTTAAWFVQKCELQDATGNAWSLLGMGLPHNKNRIRVYLGLMEIPNEPAYRVRLELAQSWHFPPENLWTVPNVPIPRPGRRQKFSRHTRLHGYTLEITHLIGEGPPGMFGVKDAPAAAIRISGSGGRYCVRDLAKTSGLGKLLDAKPVADGDEVLVDLSPQRGKQIGTLKLALTPYHQVEFLVPVRPPKPAGEANQRDGK
jgi:hypothetical protein